ncbi:MAG: hypothetical protein APZ16_01180 [Candidatus Hadarchaeum yellowstonense]|uniref:Phage-Barnase-EndoU-ColicinE5/D-RelE like nuclease 2 domain-containing protein n=1 Tax=Hadarchaeum yellowstonense TaxID=1776334 RepID=A0A147JTN7_HADYE|nr:MAG: hypothetical protein APZ16_01180 [Candidatus Hadarchaeum yellowstonense]
MRLTRSVFENDVFLDSAALRVILGRHPEMGRLERLEDEILAAISAPDFVLAGRYGNNIAVRKISAGFFLGSWLMVPYEEGGRVITAFVASDGEKMRERRLVLWRR